ncbi:MAG: TetR/AcrR family transcriptional regulator [Deltaproteobacteria bacterium]|nr:TetR/AcrR family transcriptional regulator [Deltaproteobacteria bacterium]
MPKPTFFNLPAAKRDRLVSLAIEEFSSKPYRQASLSRIVAAAGIAKGSVYQYFDNKLDLYTWLVSHEIGRRKMEAIAAVAPPEGSSIWDIVRQAFVGGFAFAAAEPKLALLGARFQRESGDPELASIVAANAAASHAWLLDLLRAGQATGEVRAGLNLDVAATMLAQTLGEGMLQVFAQAMGVDVATWMTDPSMANRLSPDEIGALVEDALDFLRSGLGPATRPTPPAPSSEPSS